MECPDFIIRKEKTALYLGVFRLYNPDWSTNLFFKPKSGGNSCRIIESEKLMAIFCKIK